MTAAPGVPGPVQEQMEIDAAMRADDCRMVDDVILMLDITPAQQRYVERCHALRQREIVSAAMSRHDCTAVMRIPGIYPRAAEAGGQRFVYHCWMAAGQQDLDSCIGMIEVGDATSLPLIVAVLQRNPPARLKDGFAVIDTAGACMSAFERITRRKARDAAPGWGGTWPEWAAQRK